MDYNYFLNTYGFQPPVGFDTRKKQLKDAGVSTEECLMYGYGYYNCENPPQSKPKCLTFTANEDGSSVGFIIFNDGYELPEDYTKPSLQYSTDGGNTWQDYDLQISDNASDAVTIDLDEGESVMFKGVNENLSYYLEDYDDWLKMQTYIEGSIAASGDVTSLLNGVGGDVTLANYCYSSMFSGCTGLTKAPALAATTTLAEGCYKGMFQGCTGLTKAPALPATTLATSCYESMFQGCTGLTTAPSLPATTLAEYCYGSMFQGCTGLTKAPALPATTLATSCYYSMFQGCTGLTTAPSLPATTLAANCYSSMFSGCTGLTKTPALAATTTLANHCYSYMFSECTGLTETPALAATTTLAEGCYKGMFQGCTGLIQASALPATTLAVGCYQDMFKGCTGLTAAPALPATTLAANCYDSMFQDCTGLIQAPALPATTLANHCYEFMFSSCTGVTSHDVATLNDSQNTFQNNTSCTSLTIHAKIPPTIGTGTITGLKADCAIYVPSASVDAYKAAQYWSARASYIQAIP